LDGIAASLASSQLANHKPATAAKNPEITETLIGVTFHAKWRNFDGFVPRLMA
jgi:hypothetical protein